MLICIGWGWCYSETDPDSSAEAGGEKGSELSQESQRFFFFFFLSLSIRAVSAKRHQDDVGLTAMETLERHPSFCSDNPVT